MATPCNHAMDLLLHDAQTVRQCYRKVKAKAKAEMKKVRSSLNLDLGLSLSHSLSCESAILLCHPRTLPCLQALACGSYLQLITM